MQDEYYRRDPHNFVRIILNKIESGDDQNNNRYTRGVAAFQRWLRDGILVQDQKPALYLYDQEYTIGNGVKKARKGFVAVMRLEEFSKGGVYPHEKTLSKPKQDRYDLLKESNTNFEHIFMLYNDDGKKVRSLLSSVPSQPLFTFSDEYQVMHRLSRVDDPPVLAEVCAAMQSKKLFIADGHHRYEVSLNYRNYLHQQGLINDEHGANFRMATFVDLQDAGLTVLPTHRMLKNVKDFSRETFLRDAQAYFDITEIKTGGSGWVAGLLDRMRTGGEQGAHVFGMFCGGSAYLLALKRGLSVRELLKTDKSDIVLNLDVSILHLVILERLLGIGARNVENEENITYVREAAEGAKGVADGAYQITFFLNPTKIEEVRKVAQAGEKMPQKSTDFYPKLSSGLVVYKF
jgi:uncharacterized protein (DUF1015 family)